jgi:CENP-B N-terminal DNA-binding domain
MEKERITMTKLANPCAKAEIINRLATNESSNQIAKDYNVSSQRIRQIKKENQEKINEIASKLVQENLSDVYETVRNDVQTMKRIAEKAKEDIEKVTDKEMQYKKDNNRTNENIFRSVGIYPAQHPSFVFNQYNDNRQIEIISPKVLDLFSSHAKTLIINGEEDEENSDIGK